MPADSAPSAPHHGPPDPLGDIRVLELGTLIAGPFAGRCWRTSGPTSSRSSTRPRRPTARLGRDVERVGVPVAPRAVARQALGRSRSARPADQAFVRALAAESDILIENFRPGRMEAWNLDPATLTAANPTLIVVRISGYGQTGPLRDQPGFGTIAEAAGGLRYLTGEPDRPPARVGLSLGDSIASLYALVGSLVALHERQTSGRGQVVDVALTEAVFSMLEGVLPEYALSGTVRERVGNIAHNSAPTNAYPCSDGALVCIAANTTSLFRGLFRAIGREDYADDPALWENQGRVQRAAELDDVIRSWTAARSADDVVTVLRERRIPVSRINSIADIVADPQFQSREMVVPVADDRLAKPLLVPGIVPKLSRTPGRIRPLARPLGADTEAVGRAIARWQGTAMEHPSASASPNDAAHVARMPVGAVHPPVE